VYFPDALAEVAALSFESNEKHNPGEPLHWSKDKSNDHKDCIIRHMTDIACKPNDLEFEISELRNTAWRSLAALQIAIEKKAAQVPTVEAVPNEVAEARQCSCGRTFTQRQPYELHFGATFPPGSYKPWVEFIKQKPAAQVRESRDQSSKVETGALARAAREELERRVQLQPMNRGCFDPDKLAAMRREHEREDHEAYIKGRPTALPQTDRFR
jgi:hypothetical protein